MILGDKPLISEVVLSQSATLKRLLYIDDVRYVWLRVIRAPSVESPCRVGRVFPYMVYIDLNHRDSQI
jgi:hypothetical protein